MKDNRVIVVDANKQFVEYVTRAAARKYIKTRSVTILKRAPQLVLMLPHGVDRVKVYFDKSNSAAKTARYRKRNEKWSEQRKSRDTGTTASSLTGKSKKSGVGT